jgi:hypothetical protein
MIFMIIFQIFLFLSALLSALSTNLNARAWQSEGDYPTVDDFPETAFLSSKPSTAIAFSGGGARAYISAVGELAALHSLQLIHNIRYIGGISGGTWATTVYSYAQNATNDDIFLGRITMPEHISLEGLKVMDPRCMRSVTREIFAGEWTIDLVKEKGLDGLAEAWTDSVQSIYLEPFAIKSKTRFSWSQEVVDDIKSRNPDLANEEFLLPTNSDRPYPVIGSTLVGPYNAAPFEPDDKNFSMVEFTPLYAGQLHKLDISYNVGSSDHIEIKIGGAIEPYAFSVLGEAPEKGLDESDTVSILSVPSPDAFLDLQHVAGTSSYCFGATLESLRILNLSTTLGLRMNYWAPSNPTPAESFPYQFLFSDGGNLDDSPLIPFLQRQVKKIILFENVYLPLTPSSDWDVEADPYYVGGIMEPIPAYFGMSGNTSDYFAPRIYNRSFDTSKLHVFNSADYIHVIKTLQQAQADGRGVLGTFNLTTVENKWWGIPAGFNTQLTIVYTNRVQGWEAQLSEEMYELVVPENEEDRDNMSIDIKTGPFHDFPHYLTSGADLNHERANLLADLHGWVVLENKELFQSILS